MERILPHLGWNVGTQKSFFALAQIFKARCDVDTFFAQTKPTIGVYTKQSKDTLVLSTTFSDCHRISKCGPLFYQFTFTSTFFLSFIEIQHRISIPEESASILSQFIVNRAKLNGKECTRMHSVWLRSQTEQKTVVIRHGMRSKQH